MKTFYLFASLIFTSTLMASEETKGIRGVGAAVFYGWDHCNWEADIVLPGTTGNIKKPKHGNYPGLMLSWDDVRGNFTYGVVVDKDARSWESFRVYGRVGAAIHMVSIYALAGYARYKYKGEFPETGQFKAYEKNAYTLGAGVRKAWSRYFAGFQVQRDHYKQFHVKNDAGINLIKVKKPSIRTIRLYIGLTY